MIAALLLAAACTPDPAYTATPVVTWDPPACLGGSICGATTAPPGEFCAPGCYVDARGAPSGARLYWQRPGVSYDSQRKMALDSYLDEQTGLRHYPGLSLPFAVQKFNASELEPINFAVTWYWGPPYNVESGKSNTVTICKPKLCRKPGPCD